MNKELCLSLLDGFGCMAEVRTLKVDETEVFGDETTLQ